MTTLLDRLRIWASTGTKTAPSTAKIDLGWVGGEQPPHEWENERMNTRDTQLVGCVDAVNDSPAGGRTLHRDRNVASDILENIGLPYSADNYFDSGDGLINGACLYEYDGTKMLVFPHFPSGTPYIKTYNINTKASTNQAYFGDYVVDVCSTGRWIYILYFVINGTDYDYFLTAVDGLTWTAKTGWPGTDPQLGKQPLSSADGRPFCRVTPVGDILCGGYWSAGSGDDKLAIVDADSGNITESGNAGLSATQFPSGNCIVVGDTLYYTGLDTSGSMLVCDAYESDLTLGGPQGVLGTPTVAGEFNTLVSLGDHFLSAYKIGTNITIAMFDESYNANWAVTTVNDAGSKLGPMCFDGVHVWALFYAEVGSQHAMVVRRFSPQSLSNALVTINIDFDADMDKNHLLHHSDTNTTLGFMRPPIVFDGCGIWVSPYAPTGTSLSGEWFRISNVYAR